MIKHYCDVCHKEINDLKHDLFPLEEQDFPFTTYGDSQRHFGKELCKNCYYKRIALHIELDLKLFGELKEDAFGEGYKCGARLKAIVSMNQEGK